MPDNFLASAVKFRATSSAPIFPIQRPLRSAARETEAMESTATAKKRVRLFIKGLVRFGVQVKGLQKESKLKGLVWLPENEQKLIRYYERKAITSYWH